MSATITDERSVLERVMAMSQVEQGSAAWHAARESMLTASSCASALGIPYTEKKTPESVRSELLREKRKQAYLRQCGTPEVSKDSMQMKHGRDNEDAARRILEQKISEKVHELGLLVHSEYSWLGASLDGMTDSGKLVEIKCPWNRAIVPGEVPEHYLPQIQVGMEVTGAEEAIFVEYKPSVSRYPEPDSPEVFEITRVTRDREWFRRNLPKLKEFHREMVSPIGESDVMAFNKPPAARRRRARPLFGDWIPSVRARSLIRDPTDCVKKDDRVEA